MLLCSCLAFPHCCNCYLMKAVSCDEAFLDITDLECEDPEHLASSIREEIFETTRCTASVGIAGNMLMARMATRIAKPNGQYHTTPERVCFGLHHYPEVFLFILSSCISWLADVIMMLTPAYFDFKSKSLVAHVAIGVSFP